MPERPDRPGRHKILPGPISHGLGEAVEASGIPKSRLADEIGVSRPQFYRFLNWERGLSQEALERLANRLGVRVVGQGEPGCTESGDSLTSPARTGSPGDLAEILARIESAIDEAFVEDGARSQEGEPDGSRGGQAAWRRLEVWLRPRTGDVPGGIADRPGDLPGDGWLPADCLVNALPFGGAQPNPASRLDSLKASILRRVRQALGMAATGAAAGGSPVEACEPPPAGLGPVGVPQVGGGTLPATTASTGGRFHDVVSFATSGGTGGLHHVTHGSDYDEGEEDGPARGLARPEPPAFESAAATVGGHEPDADLGDLLTIAGQPGDIDCLPPGEVDGEAETGSPPAAQERRGRIKPPQMNFVSNEEPQPDGDDDEEYPDGEGPASPEGTDEAEPAPPAPTPVADDDDDDDEDSSMRARLAALKAKLGDRRPSATGPELDDDLPPPRTDPEPEVDDEDDGDDEDWDNYVGPSGKTAERTLKAYSTGTRAEWSQKINSVVHDIPDGPAKEFAKHYMTLKGGPSIKERDKFFNFMRQMKANPSARQIFMVKDFGDHYEKIAAHVDDPIHMRFIGDDISLDAFLPPKDNPEAVRGQWQRILQARGIHNGVKSRSIGGEGRSGERTSEIQSACEHGV